MVVPAKAKARVCAPLANITKIYFSKSLNLRIYLRSQE